MGWTILGLALATSQVAGGEGTLPSVGSAKSPPHFISTDRLGRSGGWNMGGGPLFPGAFSGTEAPANCDLAVGPNDIVQVLNGKVAFYAKDGTLEFQTDAASFFSGLADTPVPQEPQADYDESSGRFFLVFLENDVSAEVCNILLAVSDDGDPSGAWSLYKFDAVEDTGDLRRWMERPSLGLDANGLCVTGTRYTYGTGAATGSSFYVIQKAPLLAGGTATVVHIRDGIHEHAHVGESLGLPGSYIFGATQIAPSQLRVYRVRDSGTPNPVVNFTEPTFANPQPPPPPVPSTGGALLETQTDQVVGVWCRDNRFVVAKNSLVGSDRSGVRVQIYDTDTWDTGELVPITNGLVSGPSTSYFVPAAAINKWGDLGIACSASSTSVTSDLVCVGRVPSDGVAYFSPPLTLVSASGGPYTDSRWGRYFGIDVDPVDGETFWATAMTVSSTGWWETHIEPFTVSKTWPIAPASFIWIRGVWQSGGVVSLAADDGDYNVAKAGLVLFPSEPPAQLVVECTAPSGQVLGIETTVVAKVNTPGLSQKVDLWDWSTGSYAQIGATQPATTGDSAHIAVASGAVSRFVQSGTGLVRAKVSFFRTGLTLVWPWTASVDQYEVRVRVR